MLYHSTNYSNLNSILSEGIKKHLEGVYFTDSKESALLFSILSHKKDVLIIEIDENDLDEDSISISWDSANDRLANLFKVDNFETYVYTKDVEPEIIQNMYHYNLSKNEK